jgi:hypothetical protein
MKLTDCFHEAYWLFELSWEASLSEVAVEGSRVNVFQIGRFILRNVRSGPMKAYELSCKQITRRRVCPSSQAALNAECYSFLLVISVLIRFLPRTCVFF